MWKSKYEEIYRSYEEVHRKYEIMSGEKDG